MTKPEDADACADACPGWAASCLKNTLSCVLLSSGVPTSMLPSMPLKAPRVGKLLHEGPQRLEST